MDHLLIRIVSGALAACVIVATLAIFGYGIVTDIIPVLGGDYVEISLAVSGALSLVFGITCFVMVYKNRTAPASFRIAFSLIGVIAVVGFAFFTAVLNFSSWQNWV